MKKSVLITLIVVVVLIVAGILLAMHKNANSNTSTTTQDAAQASGVADSEVSSIGQDVSSNDSDLGDNSLNDLG